MNKDAKAIQDQYFSRLLEHSLPDPSYHRYQFYKNYALQGLERGEVIYRILAKQVPLDNKVVLDLGCGYGGTTIFFALKGCKMVATDIDYSHISTSRAWVKENSLSAFFMVSAAEKLALIDKSLDIVILHGVIEHVNSVAKTISECSRVLKNRGLFFITVTNRLSILNIFSDPHFGFFGVMLLPEKIADIYIRRIRKAQYGYHVHSYPIPRLIFKICRDQGITLKRFRLINKFFDPALISSTATKNMISKINRNPVIKILYKIGLLQLGIYFFESFICRGYFLIGEKNNSPCL